MSDRAKELSSIETHPVLPEIDEYFPSNPLSAKELINSNEETAAAIMGGARLVWDHIEPSVDQSGLGHSIHTHFNTDPPHEQGIF